MLAVRRRPFLAVLAAAGAALLGTAAAHGQALPKGYPDRYPPPLPARRGPPPPPLTFHVVGTVPLPGPIQAADAALAQGRVVLTGPAGPLAVSPEPGATAEPWSAGSTTAPDTDAAGWVYAPKGGYRYRTFPEGRVVAERWWGSRGGWKLHWSLRAGGATPAPPLLVGGRLLFGSVDDQVTAVRADNGHRLWATDLKDRVSRPLALWHGEVDAEASPGKLERRPVEAVLVAPDGGTSLVALDPFDGKFLATFDVLTLPGGNALVSPAVVTPEGRVAIAHEGYVEDDAALVLLAIEAAPPPAPKPLEPGPSGPATAAAGAEPL